MEDEQFKTLNEEVRKALYAAFKQGREAGRAEAYIGHYDQYDRGSLMFKDPIPNPYRKGK